MPRTPKLSTSIPENAEAQRSPIERALALPNGARFYRCALQVNPHGYSEQFRGKPGALDEAAYVEAVLQKCAALKIEAIALTDHGSASAFALFREAAPGYGVTVFPGFELTSSEGVHVLCIYDPTTDEGKLERYLGAFDLQDTAPSSHPSTYGFRDILDKVRYQDGVTIAAHVTQDNGLFTTLKGRPCIEAWKDEALIAVQIPGPLTDLPDDKPWRTILENREPNYKRDRPASPDLAVAVVNACDVKEPADLDKPGATCWIKMSELTIDGLKQAFLDPGSRIRLARDESWDTHAELRAVTWESGFLDSCAIHFNANLNVLVGGRGTGKSTVLESIRYVLSIEPLGDEARRQHESVIRNVLGNGTRITLEVCSRSPISKTYRIERTIPNPPVVRDESGAVLKLRPSDVMPLPEVFGQHEIAELTKSPEKLTRVLTRFVSQDPALPQRLQQAQRELERSRARISEMGDELRRIDERLSTLPAVEETLKKYQDAGVELRLQDQALLVREQRVLKTVVERVESMRELAVELGRHTIDRAFLSAKALDPLPAKALLEELDPVLRELNEAYADAAKRLGAELMRADAAIAGVRARWDVRRAEAQEAYNRVLRELQREKVDGGEFLRLRAQIEELRPLAEQRTTLVRSESEERDRRGLLAVEWEDVKTAEYRSLDEAAKKVSKALKGRVRVRVTANGTRGPLIGLLRDAVGGSLAQTVKSLETDPLLSIPELAALCRGPADALARRFGIPRAQAERMADAGDGLAMQIESLRLTPTTHLELNVAPEGQAQEWRTLEDLSSGQKATAVLLLLLLESEAPLLVDQPEDDLDNRFISDGVVPTMRTEKRRRQFIFTTHNANIPVLDDAELIIGLETRSTDGRTTAYIPEATMGSIDKQEVRVLVEELLEGGKDAFEMRRRKYQF